MSEADRSTPPAPAETPTELISPTLCEGCGQSMARTEHLAGPFCTNVECRRRGMVILPPLNLVMRHESAATPLPASGEETICSVCKGTGFDKNGISCSNGCMPSPPADITEAIEDLIISVGAASECRQDQTVTDDERKVCTKDITVARSRLEGMYRELQGEKAQLQEEIGQWSTNEEELRASLASLKEEQLTREQAQWLVDLIERTPMKYPLEMNVIYKRLRAISSPPDSNNK